MTFPAFGEKTWKIIGICFAALALLALVLFTMDRCGSYRFGRDIDKRKANVNAALSNIANIQAQKSELEKQEAVEKERVRIEIENLANAVNATDAQRLETNKALENLNAARNGNAMNVTVQELEEKLRKLNP